MKPVESSLLHLCFITEHWFAFGERWFSAQRIILGLIATDLQKEKEDFAYFLYSVAYPHWTNIHKILCDVFRVKSALRKDFNYLIHLIKGENIIG